jgi:hypothetical protein
VVAPSAHAQDANLSESLWARASETNSSLVIIGEEDGVVRAAAEHAASVHRHDDTPELRQQLREFLEPPEAYTPEPRAQELLPG